MNQISCYLGLPNSRRTYVHSTYHLYEYFFASKCARSDRSIAFRTGHPKIFRNENFLKTRFIRFIFENRPIRSNSLDQQQPKKQSIGLCSPSSLEKYQCSQSSIVFVRLILLHFNSGPSKISKWRRLAALVNGGDEEINRPLQRFRLPLLRR